MLGRDECRGGAEQYPSSVTLGGKGGKGGGGADDGSGQVLGGATHAGGREGDGEKGAQYKALLE